MKAPELDKKHAKQSFDIENIGSGVEFLGAGMEMVLGTLRGSYSVDLSRSCRCVEGYVGRGEWGTSSSWLRGIVTWLLCLLVRLWLDF